VPFVGAADGGGAICTRFPAGSIALADEGDEEEEDDDDEAVEAEVAATAEALTASSILRLRDAASDVNPLSLGVLATGLDVEVEPGTGGDEDGVGDAEGEAEGVDGVAAEPVAAAAAAAAVAFQLANTSFARLSWVAASIP